MELQQRINAFVKLGLHLKQVATSNGTHPDIHVLERAEALNGWFTRDNLLFAFSGWGDLLRGEKLVNWLKYYPTGPSDKQQTIAIVMAGNIPLVGFHDLLCVLLAGHRALVKRSSKDEVVLSYVLDKLIDLEPLFRDSIEIAPELLKGFDAVIATGSNNTARYFEHYFGKYPALIRRNRNSVAVLDGRESKADLERLAEDVFRYFGLGCRNVSKVYVPREYNFGQLFEAFYNWKELVNHSKYMNNYDYNKAVYLMSDLALLDNGFLLLKEDKGIASPIAVLFYEYYENTALLSEQLAQRSDEIQIVVGPSISGSSPFGKAQSPALDDYADGVDTMAFLHQLKS